MSIQIKHPTRTKISFKLFPDLFYSILSGVAGGKTLVKLKASDIYSDDSGSDDEEKPAGQRSSSSSRSSSDFEEDCAAKITAGIHVFIFILNQ